MKYFEVFYDKLWKTFVIFRVKSFALFFWLRCHRKEYRIFLFVLWFGIRKLFLKSIVFTKRLQGLPNPNLLETLKFVKKNLKFYAYVRERIRQKIWLLGNVTTNSIPQCQLLIIIRSIEMVYICYFIFRLVLPMHIGIQFLGV